MRVLIQRVSSAHVMVDGQITGEIQAGLLIFLGVSKNDTVADASYLANKIVNLRLFSDTDGKMNHSLLEVNGQALVVSQFTLYGDCRKGRRPGFDQAASPEMARELYEQLIQEINAFGIQVATGIFQADMKVHLVNDGPVTLICESK